MRKIDKDYLDIPTSLIPAYEDLFKHKVVDESAKKTHKVRLEIIKNGSYIDEDRYNICYKKKDVKDKLSSIYHNKCAFCEQRIEQYHVEHYRPKKGCASYYWLAFSWDNLLLACPKCNISKGVHFHILGTKVAFDETEENLRKINILSSSYDNEENPQMVNPEVTNPQEHISFSRDGSIYSDDKRFKYTIDKCQLDRTYLKDERRKIFDEFENKIKSKILKYSHNQTLLKSHISELISEYICDSQSMDKEYIGFRYYSIHNGWLHSCLKKFMGSFP